MGITIKQIAQEVGLSWPAVSQILNARGRFAPDTRKRVLAVAAKRGYRPNASARALRDQSSKLIGALFRNDASNPLTNMAAFEYLLGINQRFEDADYGTLIIRAGEIEQAVDREPRVFRERLVDGVIVVGTLPDPLVERVKALASRVIWLDAPIWEDTCCVRRDESLAGESCVKAMADLGYKSVVFVSRAVSRLSHHSHASRETGARAAAKKLKLRYRVINWPEENYDQAYTAIQTLLSSGDGIIAGTLPVASQIITGAAMLRQVPGHDFGIVCCDDSVEARGNLPGLSRVWFDRFSMGIEAADMMLRFLASTDKPPLSHLREERFVPGCSAWGPIPRIKP